MSDYKDIEEEEMREVERHQITSDEAKLVMATVQTFMSQMETIFSDIKDLKASISNPTYSLLEMETKFIEFKKEIFLKMDEMKEEMALMVCPDNVRKRCKNVFDAGGAVFKFITKWLPLIATFVILMLTFWEKIKGFFTKGVTP